MCRFTAVTRPISYARQKSSRRVYVMIAIPWVISIAISSPIVLGLNYTEQRSETPTVCTFYNPDFLIYSSMGSFYIPSLVMTILYGRIYLVIRSRSRGTTGTGVRGGELNCNGRSPSAPSRFGRATTSAWRPSAWLRAIESCNLEAVATPCRLAVPPPPPMTTTTAAVGLPTTGSIAIICNKGLPAVEPPPPVAPTAHPAISSETQRQLPADETPPATTATSAINDDGRSRERRCIATSSSDDSTTDNDENDDDDHDVVDGLLRSMSCPGSSTIITMMIVGTPVDEVAGTADDIDRGEDDTVEDDAVEGGATCHHVGFQDDTHCSPKNAMTEREELSVRDLAMQTSSSVPLTLLPALSGKNSTTVAPTNTATTTAMVTTLTVPGTAAVGNGRLTIPNSLGRAENSSRLQMGSEVSVIDVDDWTIAAASADADRRGNEATGGRPSENGGSVITGRSFRFTPQPSTNNHSFRSQQKQQQQQQQQQQQSSSKTRNMSKLKRAARRERKATKTLAIVLGRCSLYLAMLQCFLLWFCALTIILLIRKKTGFNKHYLVND